jgi:hypothetical protein
VVVELSPAGKANHAFALPALTVTAMVRLPSRVIVAGMLGKPQDFGLGMLEPAPGMPRVVLALDPDGKALWQKAKLPEVTQAVVVAMAPLPGEQWLLAANGAGGQWQGKSTPGRFLGRYDAEGKLLWFLDGLLVQDFWQLQTDTFGTAVVVADMALGAQWFGAGWPTGATGRAVFALDPAGTPLWARSSFSPGLVVQGLAVAGKRASLVGQSLGTAQVVDWGGMVPTVPGSGWSVVLGW